ncbi:hypothetical protein O5O45_27560 [Hahella aquimaris]|uniref:tetratricopeptide repeat protein n=1 Tax=Hahella sp. HNIBRBA332 TaxID=3015983 RepID=UPI00273A9E6E|nr:hypothetical protein [Hahella sp. HNIBRBA332]WLQ13488.1 hypothetical protein O5O45_27560 [Hahella sp. HNIBRBA332]
MSYTLMARALIVAGALSLGAASAHGEEVAGYVKDLYHGWAHVRYEVDAKEQERGYQDLKGQADQAVDAHPEDPNVWIWKGVITSTYAGAKGGLKALSLVKEARDCFEKAMSIDANAFGGSAYTSLGALYYQAPGWPLSFGDDKEASKLLRKGLEINPDGIDANFFYGDYLREQGDLKQAKLYLEKALQATPRPDRQVADAGRRGEIQALLKKMK